MPNWTYNHVEIHAPLDQVKRYLVEQDRKLRFNMHMLFPEHITAFDPTGLEPWDHDWCVENTGSKWLPDLHIHTRDDEVPVRLAYDTAWAPNNSLLIRLAETTGRTVINTYEGEGCEFEGILTCDEDGVTDIDLPIRPYCDGCDLKFDAKDIVEHANGEKHCTSCHRQILERNPWPTLFTKDQYHRLVANGEKIEEFFHFEPKPVVKLVSTDGAATWLLSYISPQDPSMAYGLFTDRDNAELCTIDLQELSGHPAQFGCPVKRDDSFVWGRPMNKYVIEALDRKLKG